MENTDPALDFSFDAMNSDPDDSAPGVEIAVPVMDEFGTMFKSVHDAARFYHVDSRRIVRALRDGTKVRGIGFRFP